jgi:hypothetical protein
MDRRRSWTLRVLALAVAGASLAGCAVYPARPYGHGHGGGYGYRPYAYSAPAWGGRARLWIRLWWRRIWLRPGIWQRLALGRGRGCVTVIIRCHRRFEEMRAVRREKTAFRERLETAPAQRGI